MADRHLRNLAEVAAHLNHLHRHQLHRCPPRPSRDVRVGHEMLKKEEWPGGVVHHHAGYQLLALSHQEGQPAWPGVVGHGPSLDEPLVLA